MSPTSETLSAADALLDAVLERLSTERGVHVESAAVCLGALAGHACQLYVLRDGEAAVPELMVVSGNNGATYYFGNSINGPLIESPESVWAILSATADSLDVKVPDVEELFRYAASVVGSAEFGVPRYAPDTYSEPPVSFLPLWDSFAPLLRNVPTAEWPVAYALAIGLLLSRVNGQFPLEPLVQIAMESAIAMAKLKG